MRNHQSRTSAYAAAVALIVLIGGPDAGAEEFKTRLSGFAEVPALSSPGSGEFEARINGGAIEYTLSYRGLDSGVLFAHIHLGQRGVNGGVSVFLCSNAPAPVPTPACPVTGGTVSGVLEAEDVIGPSGQGIAPGELGELLDAIESGVTYVNVHTNDFPAGEIRGQLRHGLARP